MLGKSKSFETKLKELQLPLQYAILFLLSNGHASILNPTLLQLIDGLIKNARWNQSERFAEYASFLIDRLSLKMPSFSPIKSDLVSLFATASSD